MKSFKAIMSEVAQPKSPEEKKFKDMHSYETKSHPVAPDAVFTGAIGADDLPREKAKRKADQEGDANYDKQFKTEETEQVNELSKNTLGNYIKKAADDVQKSSGKAGYASGKGVNKSEYDSQTDNAEKRAAGIKKATNKLTREELELEISEDLKMVSRQEHPKGGHIVTLQDKNGKKIVRHLNKGKVTDMKSEEAVDEGSIKGSGTDRKSVLKKAFRSGEQDTRQFNTPGGAATNKPKRGSDATVKKAYQAGRDSEQGDSAYKGTRRSKPQDTLGYKKNEAVDEGILDNIKKKVNDVRRKVVGPNQAEKDAARKKMMARQHASTMKNIGSAMGAVAKKDKAAEVARLKQGLKNVENQRKESVNETTMSAVRKPVTVTGPDGKTRTVMRTTKNKRTDDHGQDIIKAEDKAQVNAMVKAALGGKTKMKESLLASILESLAQADETLEEGPFKGVGKMLMKRKLNKTSKSLAKQKKDIEQVAGFRRPGEPNARLNDIKSKTNRIQKATDRLKREGIAETTSSALKRPVTQTGPDGKTRTVLKKETE